MFKLAVLSNPRSGTSLLTHLVLTGFGLVEKSVLSAFTGLEGKSIYDFRVRPYDLLKLVDNTYKVFFILRDPRNVITSIHPSYTEDYLVGFDTWYSNYCAIKEDFLHLDNVFVIRYEDLLNSPDEEQERMSAFLGLPVEIPFTSCYEHYDSLDLDRVDEMNKEMGGSGPLNASKVDRWKEAKYSDRIKQQLCKYHRLADILVSLGYEVDNSWVLNYK